MASVHLSFASPRRHQALAEVLSSRGWQVSSQPEALTLWDGEAALPEHAGSVVRLEFPLRAAALFETLAQAMQMQPLPIRGKIALDVARRRLVGAGAEIELTEKETELLRHLIIEGESTRQQLLRDVWNYHDEIDTHTLETHLYRLRAKLEEALGAGEWVVATEQGYRLRIEDDR